MATLRRRIEARAGGCPPACRTSDPDEPPGRSRYDIAHCKEESVILAVRRWAPRSCPSGSMPMLGRPGPRCNAHSHGVARQHNESVPANRYRAPGGYPDRTLTGWRRRAFDQVRSLDRMHERDGADGGQSESEPDQEAPEVHRVVLVAGHALGAAQHYEPRRQRAEDEPIEHQPVEVVERQHDDEGVHERADEREVRQLGPGDDRRGQWRTKQHAEVATIGVVGLGEPAPGADLVAGGDLGLPVGRGSAAEVVEQGEVVDVGHVLTAQTRQARKLERGEGVAEGALEWGVVGEICSERDGPPAARRGGPPRPAWGSMCRSERSLVCLAATIIRWQSIRGARHKRRL